MYGMSTFVYSTDVKAVVDVQNAFLWRCDAYLFIFPNALQLWMK